ncbi:MAG: tyrosine-type recombinase/integrase, partial [Desulfomonile tiedjei]|nr:tyrosine-type recombinase/integrase [Desulfomonile tiedjei]
MVTKRGEKFHIKFYAYGQEVGLSTPAKTKREARDIEEAIKRACRIGDASWLDPASREVCSRLFKNRGWALLPGLSDLPDRPQEELTLWKAVEACLKHPEVRNSANRERHEQSFLHVIRYFGKDFRIQDLWIPEIKEYLALRVSEGAAASTISKERSALGLMFKCLIEYQMVDRNPVREVKGPSDPARREVYISWNDFQSISALLPPWVRPITWTLYFTGMRRGEVTNLTWDNIDLTARVIRLSEDQTKERKRKRVPISRNLIPILLEAGHVRLISKKVFHIQGREPSEDSLRKPWVAAVKAAGLNPLPTIHDIRHVWKTNA